MVKKTKNQTIRTSLLRKCKMLSEEDKPPGTCISNSKPRIRGRRKKTERILSCLDVKTTLSYEDLQLIKQELTAKTSKSKLISFGANTSIASTDLFIANMTSFSSVIAKLKVKGLHDEHIRIMAKTPFNNLFKCYFEDMVKPYFRKKWEFDFALVRIINSYDETTDSFGLQNQRMQFTSENVSQILGLQSFGTKKIRFKNQHMLDPLLSKYFKHGEHVQKGKLEHILLNIVESRKQEDIVDTVRLICMMLCCTLLFARSWNSIPNSIANCMISIDEMSEYDWPSIVWEFLVESIKAQKSRPSAVKGCVPLLAYLYCEATNCIEPEEDAHEGVPSFVRWDIRKFLLFMDKPDTIVTKIGNGDNGQTSNSHGEKSLNDNPSNFDCKIGDKTSNPLAFQGFTTEELLITVDSKRISKFYNNSKSSAREMVDFKRDKTVELQKKIEVLEMELKMSQKENQKLKETIEVLTMGRSIETAKDSDIKSKFPNEELLNAKHGCVDLSECDYVDETMEKTAKRIRRKLINIDKWPSAKILPAEVKAKLDFWINQSDPRKNIFHIELGSISPRDIEKIVTESLTPTNVIDAHIGLLKRELKDRKFGSTDPVILSTFAWRFNKEHGSIEKHVTMPILQQLHKASHIIVPLHHESRNHYTLMYLDKEKGVWWHMDTLLPRFSPETKKCFIEAKQMYDKIQKILESSKANASSVLANGYRTIIGDNGSSKTCAKVLLSEGERKSFEWISSNSINFELLIKADTPQQDEGSVDCGIAMMYFIRELVLGRQISNSFPPDCLLSFRAEFLRWVYEFSKNS